MVCAKQTKPKRRRLAFRRTRRRPTGPRRGVTWRPPGGRQRSPGDENGKGRVLLRLGASPCCGLLRLNAPCCGMLRAVAPERGSGTKPRDRGPDRRAQPPCCALLRRCALLRLVAPCFALLRLVAPCCALLLRLVAPCCASLRLVAPCCAFLLLVAPCCGLLLLVAACCGLMSLVAVCCGLSRRNGAQPPCCALLRRCALLRLVAPCFALLRLVAPCCALLLRLVAPCCASLRLVAPCCAFLLLVAPCCGLLLLVAACCGLMSLVAVCCGLSRRNGARERSRATAARIDGPSRHPAAAAGGAAIYCGSLRRLIAQRGRRRPACCHYCGHHCGQYCGHYCCHCCGHYCGHHCGCRGSLRNKSTEAAAYCVLLRLIASYCEVDLSGPTRQLRQPARGAVTAAAIAACCGCYCGVRRDGCRRRRSLAGRSRPRAAALIAAYCGLAAPLAYCGLLRISSPAGLLRLIAD